MRTLEFGVLFRGVAIIGRCVLTSPDQANGSFTTLGIALSYLYSRIHNHYEFVLYYTYEVLPDIPLVYGGVYSVV